MCAYICEYHTHIQEYTNWEKKNQREKTMLIIWKEITVITTDQKSGFKWFFKRYLKG